jgi:hypothetical protein
MRPAPTAGKRWLAAFLRNLVLWLILAGIFWGITTPIYNRMLLSWSAGLLHLAEHPKVTELLPRGNLDAYIQRLDFPPIKSLVFSFRVSDLHFPFILLVGMFLAVPRVPWRKRLANLGIALLISAAFDVVLVILYVKSCYANQLGGWSLDHYGAVARNVYGMGKHLFDLPLKLALPLVLWAGFYLPELREALAPGRPAATPPPPRPTGRSRRAPSQGGGGGSA